MATIEAESDPQAAVAAVPLWYHTIDLAPGVTTPGWFDLRPVADRLPWPDVAGKRCLDVGPWDGFYAFELERRGAAEVVAADIGDHREWDWPLSIRSHGPEIMEEMAGAELGVGFQTAKRALGSSVERVEVSAYDLSRRTVGEFDVVVCGDLLLHLRDPVAALEAIRGVCREAFMSAELIDLWHTVIHPRRPGAGMLRGVNCQWWLPNAAAHRAMIEAAGFEVERSGRPYAVPFGEGHKLRTSTVRDRAGQALVRLVTGQGGTPHAALLARPA